MPTKKPKAHSRSSGMPQGLEILPTPVLVYRRRSGEIQANPCFEREFGPAVPARFESKVPLHLIHEKPLTLPVLSMPGRHEGYGLETRDHRKVPVELKISSFGDPADETFLVMIENVSSKVDLERQLIDQHLRLKHAFDELKKTQAALVQAAKLASLGELSSGIAHELNQPLQAIMGFSQELQHVEKLSPTGNEFVGDIVSAKRKMAEIIRSLRTFAREAGEELSATSVDHAVHEAVKLMNHQLMSKGIEIEIFSEESLPLVTANPIQLEQVFVNVLSNARDAIEQVQNSRPGRIQVTLSQNENEIHVSIRDNGCGMDEKTRKKIFDPFFTTKEVGKGTGLGMSISYGLLKKIHAGIDVRSTPGEGSEFIISIPKKEMTSQKTGEAA